MIEHPQRFIWFCSTEYVAQHPDSLKKLRDEIGLTTIMPESSVCHTSGFRASDEIVQRGPFEDWRSREALWPKAKDGIYPPVAGTVGGFDDTPLLRVIEACRETGIEIWGHLGLWSYGGDVYPEYAMVDIFGKPLDMRYKQWGIGLCPSRRRINEWTRDCLIDVIKRYDIDGFDVDHARYPAPANISGLFACACEACQEEALRLGYDFHSMKEGLFQLHRALNHLTQERLLAGLEVNLNFWDFLSYIGDNHAVLEWLKFRAVILAERMQEFRDAVRRAAGSEKVFGSDVFPPSIALLGGHLYAEWEAATDYLTGGSSFGGVVGWATTVTNLATEWAAALCQIMSGLNEGIALQTIYQMFGYGDLALPLSVAGIQQESLPLSEMYLREVTKLKALTSGKIPLYPPVSASGDPQLVRELCTAVVDNRCDGALFTLNPEGDENLKVIREVFGR